MSARTCASAGEGRGAPVPADGSGPMFDAIARRYDLLNRLLSLGLDQAWRRAAIGELGVPPSGRDARPSGRDTRPSGRDARPSGRVLDVATGTGDVALSILRRHPRTTVCGLDPSPAMLERARRKAKRARCLDRLTLVPGEAEQLPFPDASFDAAIVAFGMRNMRDRSRALAEMARVVVPPGRVVVLELCLPVGRGPAARLAAWWVRHLVPRVGGWLSRGDAYRYLERSMAAFPPASEFALLLRRAGLEVRSVRPLAFGVAHVFVAAPGGGA